MNRNWNVVTFQNINECPRPKECPDTWEVGNLRSLWRKMKCNVLFKKSKLDPNLHYLFHRYLFESQKIITCHTRYLFFSPCLHLYVLSCSFLTTELWCDSKIQVLSDSGACERLNYAIDLLCDAIHVCLGQRVNELQNALHLEFGQNLVAQQLVKKCMTNVASIKTYKNLGRKPTIWNILKLKPCTSPTSAKLYLVANSFQAQST